jgi:hypothetical protein
MHLDGNYSTINNKISSFSIEEGILSRIIVSIPSNKYDTGITGGDVIFFNNLLGPVNGNYRKSKADSPTTAEVFGIVESVELNGDLNVVISGSINLPTLNIFNTNNTSLNLGSNDVYFLSGQTAGALENYPPTTENYIIKPIYLNAPHGSFTGLVRNYLGYKNQPEYSTDQILSTFSEDMSKSLTYNEYTQRFIVNDVSYSSNTFNSTEKYVFDKFDLETAASQSIDFLLTSDYDSKISDDGKHILLFGKPSKKIYYIYINNLNDIELKATIDVDLVGNPDDLLWAVDNEVTCFTVGTRSLDREADRYDTQINAYQLSSKIEYWKRNVNNTSSPFRWRRVHNTQAKGFLFSKSLSYNNAGPQLDELYVNGGVHRLSDVWCRNKNFTTSYKTLIEDQIEYQTKISTMSYERYDTNIRNLISEGITSGDVLYLAGICSNIPSWPNGISASTSIQNTILLSNLTTFTNHTFDTDQASTKRYSCRFNLNHFKILGKTFGYYYDDPSYKKDCFLYDEIIYSTPNQYDLSTFYNNTKGKTLNNSIKELLQLSNRMVAQSALVVFEAGTTFTSPNYSKNALLSKSKTTETFTLISLLYEYINHTNGNKSKHLIICKYPFYAFDNFNVLQYYHRSDEYQRILPNDGTNFGHLISFKSSTIGPQIIGKYGPNYTSGVFQTTFARVDVIPYQFTNDTTISNPNIDQINNFELFTSNDRFFICTSNKIIVWTYSLSSYIVISYDNFDKALFWYNNNGEFFKLNDKILRYDSSSQNFIEQVI